MVSEMDSDEEKRLPCDQENNKSDGFDRELSEEVEKMINKASSIMKISEGKAKKIEKANELASESGMRECDFCGRKFSSGKALGGHRRYHLQALKKTGQSLDNNKVKIVHSQSQNNNLSVNTPKKSILVEEKQQLDDDDHAKLVSGKLLLGHSRCCLCKKYFPSKKSLFGHMRSHPEREWRGVKPPFVRNGVNIDPPLDHQKEEEEEEFEDLNLTNNNNNGSSSSASAEEDVAVAVAAEAVDLLVSCSSSWMKKDKRGRRSIGAIEAAETLVILSRYGNNRPFLPPPPSPPPQDAAPPVIPVKKRKKNIINDVKEDNAEEIWKLKAMTRKKEKKLKESKCTAEEIAKKEELMITSCYECNLCHKSFSTFQALGGHRSRHNKSKNVVSVVSTKKEEDDEDEAAAHKVCVNETFSSTSALGGNHNNDYNNMIMRSLSTGSSQEDASLNSSEDRLLFTCDNNDNVEEEEEEEEELGEASQSGSKMLDIDLNEPYVMEDGPSDKSPSFQ